MALHEPIQHEGHPTAHPKDMAALKGAGSPLPPKAGKTRRGDHLAAAVFLAPNFIGFLLFVAFPIIFSLFLVFTNWSLKPAIETRYTGLQNLWVLVGFRPRDAGTGASLPLFLFYFASYGMILGGLIGSFVSYGRKSAGIRLNGWITAITGLLLVLFSIATVSSVGWALFGITLTFAALFFVIDTDAPFVGPGATGALVLAAGCIAVRLLHLPFSAQWEPLDALFYKYLYNTLYLMFLIPIQIAGSLALALVLTRPVTRFLAPSVRFGRLPWTLGFTAAGLLGGVLLWLSGHQDAGLLWMLFWFIAASGSVFGITSFRTIFFLPSFTAGVAVMLLWKQMYNPNFGLLNESLRNIFPLLGIDADPPKWLFDPAWAKPALILMGFWMFVGGTNMLIYLAGLAGIPNEMYEASRIDGANKWQEFINITWPQLAPTTFFIVIMSTIAGLQGGFEQARVMTEGGPAGSTKTLSYYIYEKAFQELSLGYASAVAWIMFLLIFGLTALNWKFGNQYVND